MIPRPDFKRDKYIVLNGKWDFCFDDENVSTNEEKISGHFSDYEINVPFAYQSKLSGINSQKYHEIIWYAKTITIDKEDLNNTILLKLGAVDSSCSIYVNGKHVKDHDGGYSQIDADITDCLIVGENRIVVKAVDNRYTDKPRGKQYWKDKPDRCWYTETSGIHRTCFLEFAGKTYIEYFRILPDIDTNTISLDMSLSKPITGKLEVEISYKNNLVKDYVVSLNDDHYVKETLTIKPEDDIDETTYWSIDNPNLYDIKFYLYDHNKLVDKVSSYFGLRKVEIKDNYIYLNHKPIYQRLILQQGYWKDSLTTPIDEEAIIKDLTMIKEMGFNGVRMHQKCEDPLFYYHADRLGLLVWLEMPSSYNFNLNSIDNNFRQWKEIIAQNYNHPSIIAYVPINESWGVRKIYCNKEQIQFANAMYEYTKALDPSRIVSTNDGWELSAKTDIYGFHQYFGDPEQF
ncbi:MAG: glycoside hydrolase family 2, partial [Firmicutes bacterium]|nr:glycoside hydrolase family 2 [Candidatus Colivicinus equi]